MSDGQARVFEGMMNGSGFKFGIVASRFNAFITEKLLEGALDALRRHGADLADVDVAWVREPSRCPWWLVVWRRVVITTR